MREWQKSGFKNLPQGWEIVRLGDIAEIIMGSSPKSSAYNQVGDGLPLIQGKGDLKDRYPAPKCYTSKITKACKEGDIILSVRAPVGYVAKSAYDACIGRGVCAIRAENRDFLYFVLIFMENAWLGRGSIFEAVNKDEVKKFRLPLPPLKEQEKIAEILNLWDAQIAEVQDLIYHKQRLKTGLMQKLFTQSLHFKGFAESWSKVRLGDITEIKRGQTITEATRIDGDIPVIAGGKQPAYFCDRYNRTGENITISSSGTAGFVNYFATPIFASDCFTIQGLENLAITKYLYYYLKSIQNKIYSLQSGSVQTHVYPSDMEGMRLHLPPLKEQEKIAEILSVADEEIELLVQKHQALETQKRALMQRLLTGKVRV